MPEPQTDLSDLVDLAARAQALAADLLEAATRLNVRSTPPDSDTTLASSAEPSRRIWLSVEQAADRAGLHWRTVADACRDGSLHGAQRTEPNGRWRIHVDCLDAWAAGSRCEHQHGADG